jgi:hypothetical protein
MIVEAVSNPVWADAAETSIDCSVKFAEFPQPVPYTAGPSDASPHGTKLRADLLAGIYGPIGAYVLKAAPVPDAVSDRQFFHACAKVGMISQPEALAAVKTGDIPAELQAIVDSIPDPDARFDAQMFLSGAVEFRRDHPLTESVRVARSMTGPQVDDLFRLAASL